LQNSVAIGCILVIAVIMTGLGIRSSLMVGIAIPASFLAGVLGLALAGLTLNIVVLFSLILAVGMLVDDAIIVAEFAERRMAEGMAPKEAYVLAAERMSGPVIATTVARVAVFFPLLVWPGIVGQFMKFMPITLIATLSASLVFALIFTPTLGATFSPGAKHHEGGAKRDGPYIWLIGSVVRAPWLTLLITLVMLTAIVQTYGRAGLGVEFFPKIEPDYGLVQVRARGNLSIGEKDRLVRQVERVLADMKEIATIYARAGENQRGSNEVTEDTVGTVQYEFVDWQKRRSAGAIMDDIRARTVNIPGVIIEVNAPRGGPPTGKPVTIRLSSLDPEVLPVAALKVKALLDARRDLRDIDDGLPLPGIDWTVRVDRAQAARFGATAGTVGTAVQLVTNGVKVSEYRPNETDKAVDIIVRYPDSRRTLDELEELRINTPAGSVPIANFVTREPVRRVGVINRAQGQRIVTVTANTVEGVPTARVQQEIVALLARADLGPGITYKLKGEDEERRQASEFLSKAFAAALFLVFAILLAQFNNFTSVGLIMTAVIFSTIGVLVGLMVMSQAFGVVMTGIGVIANSGVIVNNNIVLIDLYRRLRAQGWEASMAIVQTCRERARPVVLTAVTAVLSVLPIAFGVNLDFIEREVSVGAPSTQWWIHLSTATVFGLSFATMLTLVVTPAMLMAVERMALWRRKLFSRFDLTPVKVVVEPGAGQPAAAPSQAPLLPLKPTA
jgi:multidrug efflux pump